MLYRAAIRTPAAAAGAPYAALLAGVNNRVDVREIHVTLAAATLTPMGLIRAATVGTATTSTAGQPVDVADAAATAAIQSAWSTAPTIPGSPVYLDRKTFPASIGAGRDWYLQRGELVIPAGGSLLLWNFHATDAGAASDVTIVWDE